jgi:hypothetical protein
MRTATHHLANRAGLLLLSPVAVLVGGWMVMMAGGVAERAPEDAIASALVMQAVFFAVLGAVLVPLFAALEGMQDGRLRPLAHPGLPLGAQTRVLTEGLALAPALLLGALICVAIFPSIPLRWDPIVRGLLVLLPVVTMSGWQTRRPDLLAVVPGVAIGGAAMCLAWLPTVVMALGSAALVAAVVAVGPWLVAHRLLWPTLRWPGGGRLVGPRRAQAPSRTLARDAAAALVTGPMQLGPMLLASLLVVGGFVALVLLMSDPSGTRDAWTGYLPGFAVATVGVTAAIALMLAPVSHPLGIVTRPEGQGGPPAERLIRTWERLPVSLRHVRLRALVNAALSSLLALELGVAVLALTGESWRPGPGVLLFFAVWAAMIPAITLGDRLTRGVAWAFFMVLVLSPVLEDGVPLFDTSGPAVGWIAATAALALPALLLRPGAQGRR